MNKIILIAIGAIVLVGLYLMSTYNSFVSLDETVNNKWAQVETQYQRRYDLIPNLVESVKGIMEQEQEVFGQLAEARSQYAGAGSVDEQAQAAGQVESALSRLLVVMENYPELRSSESVQTLMAQLEGTENRVSVERKRYNDAVTSFNRRIKTVPAGWVGQIFGFEARSYFESVSGADVAPGVDL